MPRISAHAVGATLCDVLYYACLESFQFPCRRGVRHYARETVYQFLNGHYSRISSNDGLIRTAIRDFIAAHPVATL